MPHKTIEARREYARKWRLANPRKRVKKPEQVRQEYLRHRAAYIARSKAWQAENPEKAKESKQRANRKRWATKRSEILAKAKVWRTANPDKVKEGRKRAQPKHAIAKKLWKQKNRDKVSAHKRKATLLGRTAQQDHIRRARLRGVGYVNCKEHIAELKILSRFCRWCCIPLTARNFSIDHVAPLSRGGCHTPHNLVAACRTCNLSKGNKLVSEWLREAA